MGVRGVGVWDDGVRGYGSVGVWIRECYNTF